MSEELAKKKRVRGAHKASATKIMQQVTELVESESPNQTKLACLRLALNEKLETLKALDVEVIELIEDDSVVTDIERADEFKETVFSSLLSIDRIIERLKPTPVTTTTMSDSSSTCESPIHIIQSFSYVHSWEILHTGQVFGILLKQPSTTIHSFPKLRNLTI